MDKLIEADIDQTKKEADFIFRSAVVLIILDIVLMLTKIARPGRWFYELVSNWIYPIVVTFGGVVFLYSIYKFAMFFGYYRKHPEYRNRLKQTLFKTGAFIFSFIVFIFFINVANIYIPERIPIENWI